MSSSSSSPPVIVPPPDTTPTPPPPSTTTSSTPSPPATTSSTTTTTTTSSGANTTISTSSTTNTSTATLTNTSTTPTSTSTSATPITQITTPLITTGPNGGAVTQTLITTVPLPSVTPTQSSESSNSGSGFFHNTGAVAGVFTVVGLIVLAILIALITNSIRRRRAKRFDDEIAAAARDAANTEVPNFGYDDDDFHPAGGAYGAGGANPGAKFSDVSHGTYAQPPMSVPESYGMRELPHHGQGPAPGEYFDGGGGYGAALAGAGAGAGAAGIGVARARSMRDGGYAAGLQEGSSPYAAFAVPGAHNNLGNAPQYPPGMIRGAGAPEFDLSRRPSQYTQQSSDYPQSAALSKNKSMTGTTHSSTPSYQTDPSYFPSNNQGPQGYPNSFGAYSNTTPSNGGTSGGGGHLPQIPSSRSEENLESAYDGYVVDEPHPHQGGPTSSMPDPLPNPFSAHSPNADYVDETDDEVEEPRRILKVANE